MPLKSIQLCHIDKGSNKNDQEVWSVTVHSDDEKLHATFLCPTEHDGIQLRNAIREHATRLRRVADYNR